MYNTFNFIILIILIAIYLEKYSEILYENIWEVILLLLLVNKKQKESL